MAGKKISQLDPVTPILTDLLPFDRPTTGTGAPVTGKATVADLKSLLDQWEDGGNELATTSSVSLSGNSGPGYFASDAGADTFFYVSGSIGARDTATPGLSVLGGDALVSGTIYAISGITGSITKVTDGSDYLQAGTGISLTVNSNGSITIDSTGGGGGGGNDYWESTVNGEIFATGTLAAVTGSLWAQFLSSSNGLQITGTFTHGIATSATGGDAHAQGNSTTASGNHSHAEGGGTSASNTYSHAEGQFSSASGAASHSEGYSTTASGDYSHAEGTNTVALEYASHAEGNGTTASGDASHAEGSNTIASGDYSHAEGESTTASGVYSHAEGYATLTGLSGYSVTSVDKISQSPNVVWTIAGDIGQNLPNYIFSIITQWGGANNSKNRYLIVTSSYDGLDTHITASNPYGDIDYPDLTLYPNLDITFELNSLPTPTNATLEGPVSHAEGESNFSLGYASHAEGYTNKTLGNHSHAEGLFTITAGDVSHSEGYLTLARGIASHAEGESTVALEYSSHAEGYASQAGMRGFYLENASNAQYYPDTNSQPNYAIYQITSSRGDVSQQFAQDTSSVQEIIIDDSYSQEISRFIYTIISSSFDGTSTYVTASDEKYRHGFYSPGSAIASADRFDLHTSPDYGFDVYQNYTVGWVHAEGYITKAVSQAAHSEGYYTIASGRGSHAEGTGSFTHGVASHAEGHQTLSVGLASHAEGYRARSSGSHSHAEGSETLSLGTFSHSEGFETVSSTSGSHAEGSSTFAGLLGYPIDAIDTVSQPGYAIYTIPATYGDVTSVMETIHVVDTSTNPPRHALYSFASPDSNFDGINTHVTASDTYGFGFDYYVPASSYIVLSAGGSTQSPGADVGLGIQSHAEGSGSFTIGDYSHAEGLESFSVGYASHAEGTYTSAVGIGSHAEGNLSFAFGEGSHAEGAGTIAYGLWSHAEGTLTVASGNYSHAGGEQTIASGSAQTVFGKFNRRGNTDSLFIIGNGDNDIDANRSDILLVNSQSVMVGSGTLGTDVFFYVTGSAGFKDGPLPTVSLFEGDVVVSGTVYALTGITGSLTKLSNGSDYLLAGAGISLLTGANGDITISLAGGGGGSEFWQSNTAGLIFATGTLGASISGSFRALSLSASNGAIITGSVVMGDNVASGIGSHAQGRLTTASAWYSHTEGLNTRALAPSGPGTAQYSHAEGQNTEARNDAAHAEGFTTIASGFYSHAEGSNTQAIGTGAHSEGSFCWAQGNYSHAEGESSNTAVGTVGSHAEGYFTFARASYSHTEGRDTDTYGQYSHAEGRDTATYGLYSHAEGTGSIAVGITSHAEGVHTIASGSGQLTIGKFNLRNNNFSLFVIGDGTGDANANRSDIVRVNSGSSGGTGTVEITGSLSVSGSSSTFSAFTGVRYFPDIVTVLPFTASLTDYIIAVSSSNPTAATNYGIELPGAEFGRTFVVKDISGSAASSNITVTAAGSTNIQRSIDGATNYVLSINRGSATFVYFGDTRGWGVI